VLFSQHLERRLQLLEEGVLGVCVDSGEGLVEGAEEFEVVYSQFLRDVFQK